MGTFRVEVTLKPQSENNSGGQPLSDGRIERFSGQVMREAQDVATADPGQPTGASRSEEHTSELQSHSELVCRLLLEKKKNWIPTRQFRTHPREGGSRLV